MAVPDLEIHEIQTLTLRAVFAREDTTFTPWLALPPNLARLGQALGIELQLLDVEARLTDFRTDILAENAKDGTRVIIENQFNRSDHDHLGKTLTYLAGHDAHTVVWLAESFSDDHLAALTWLNENTPDGVYFFAVIPRVLRIADSPPGLQFDVELRPNHFVKRVRSTDRQISATVMSARERLWLLFFELANADPVLAQTPSRYGGRLSFAWLIPQLGPEFAEYEPHVLLYLSAPSGQTPRLGLQLKGNNTAPDEIAERCATLWQRLSPAVVSGLPAANLSSDGLTLEANLDTDEELTVAIAQILPVVRDAVLALAEEFQA